MLGSYFFSTLVSQSLMDVVSTAVLIAFLFQQWKLAGDASRFFSQLRGLSWAGAGKYFAFLVLCYFMSTLLAYFMGKIQLTTTFFNLVQLKWILFFPILIFFFQDKSPSETWLRNLSIFILVASVYSMIISVIGFDLVKDKGFTITPIAESGLIRTGGFLSNPMTYGHLLGMTLCFCLAAALLSFDRIQNIFSPALRQKLLALSLLVGSFSLLLTYTRGAWLGIGTAFIAMSFSLNIKRGFKAVGLLALAVLGVAILWPGFRERLFLSLQWGNEYDSERLWIWKANWMIWMDHFWLGVSPNENKELSAVYYQLLGAPAETLHDHAHNQYLEFAATLGVFGLCGWIALNWFFFKKTVILLRQKATATNVARTFLLGCLGVQTFFLFGGLTEANFNHSKIKTFMVFVWAWVCASGLKRSEKTEAEKQ